MVTLTSTVTEIEQQVKYEDELAASLYYLRSEKQGSLGLEGLILPTFEELKLSSPNYLTGKTDQETPNHTPGIEIPGENCRVYVFFTKKCTLVLLGSDIYIDDILEKTVLIEEEEVIEGNFIGFWISNEGDMSQNPLLPVTLVQKPEKAEGLFVHQHLRPDRRHRLLHPDSSVHPV